MLGQHVAQIRPSLALVLGLLLQTLEFFDAAGDLEIGGTLAAIA